MKLRQILEILHKISKIENTGKVYICGGIPRDKLIGEAKSKYNDLDITTGDASIKKLANQFAHLIGQKFEVKRHVAKDGHISVDLGPLKVDFSSNFIIPDVENHLAKLGIAQPTDLQKEMFSRDFTCNSLLLDLNLKDIYDITGRGKEDIKNKIIKTCIDVDTTLRNKPQRIPRVYYVAAKLGFDVDSEIINWIKNNLPVFMMVETKYSLEKIMKAVEFDRDRTVALLDATDGWKVFPQLKGLI